MTELTSKQLRHAANVKEKIESLQGELNKLLGEETVSAPAKQTAPKKRRKMSAAARAKISAAAKARWAKVKAGKQ
jgi:hypothetical protein